MTQYRIRESVRSTHNPDGAIVLELQRGEMFSLNVVGSRILEMVKSRGELNEATIAEHISHEFSINREVAAKDVREFLQSLVGHQLIERPTLDVDIEGEFK